MTSKIEWWWDLINSDEDFKSLPPETQKTLLERLQQCTAHFNQIALDINQIKALVDEVGPTVVFDAILVSWTWPDEYKRNPYVYIANLKREIVQHFLRTRTIKTIIHKEPVNRHATEHPVDLDYIKKKNPCNFESEKLSEHKCRGRKRLNDKIQE